MNVAENSILESMTGTACYLLRGTSGTTLFFRFQELTHIYLSQNNPGGEVDVLFAPAPVHANFSHNYFSSINKYRRFKHLHDTLGELDVNHNIIQEEVSKLMQNLPRNMEGFNVLDNQIYGTFPETLE